MVQIKKIEGQIEIKSHANKFFDVWVRNPHHVYKLCPHKLAKIELNKGHNWHTVGSIMAWSFLVDGNHEFGKSKIVEVDEERRSVTYELIEGSIMKSGYYRSVKSKWEMVPKGESMMSGSIVKGSLEYEVVEEDSPELDFVLRLCV